MHLRKRGNKWYYVLSLTDKDGKRKLIERSGGFTKREARLAAMKAIGQNVNAFGDWDEPSRIPFRELWEQFLVEYVDNHVKKNTQRNYRSLGRIHLLPEFGDVPLGKFTPRMVQGFIDECANTHSSGTLKQILTVLKSCFKFACVTCEYLPRTPIYGISIPKKAKPPQKTSIFSPQQIKKLFARYPFKHKLHTPMMLSYYTGMRVGECLSLKWSDVDLTKATICVHSTLVMDSQGVCSVQDSPKTSSSNRIIPIGQKLVTELRNTRKYQLEQKLQYGKFWQGTDFVCTLENGQHLKHNHITRFNVFCGKEFQAGTTFHSLRHTHATMLLEAGEDLELVSKRLGHSNLNITAKIYSHVLDQRMQKTRALLDEVL